MTSVRRIATPWGAIVLLAREGRLRGVHFEDAHELARERLPSAPPTSVAGAADAALLERTAGLLADYAAGQPVCFDLPLEARGTPFQQAIWQALARWPYGRTLSYGELAAAAGYPAALRAVGNAVGANPWVIVVPCHRVLASGGRLGGFSSGLDRKRALLQLEGVCWREAPAARTLRLRSRPGSAPG